MFFLAYLTPFLSLVVSAVFLKEAIELCAFVALDFIVGGILLQGAWAAGEGSCRGDFISGVPLHFIPGQAAPDSAFASLPYGNGSAVLRILNAKIPYSSFENQSSTFKNDLSFTTVKSETLRVTRTIPLAMAVAAICVSQ